MLIMDTERIERAAALAPIESHADACDRLLAAEEKNCVLVEDGKLTNPSDEEIQMGEALSHVTFEAKLTPHLPANYAFVTHPWDASKRWLVRTLPDGERETVVVFESGIMPEHSILTVKWVWKRDRSVRTIERSALPKYNIHPVHGVQWDEGAPRPGWKRVAELGREKKRGWRTVLIRMAQKNIISTYLAESLFGADDRPHWAAGMGKQHLILPW